MRSTNWSTTTSPLTTASTAAAAFGLHVWVNNSWLAAKCIAFSVVLGVPIPFVLFANAANLGVVAGLMLQAGKGDVLLGLLLPHSLLELTAVFLAGAVGMRLGWSVISPGDRPRGQVLAEQGRAVISVAVGLVVVLLVSGAIEAFVTPSPLPTFAADRHRSSRRGWISGVRRVFRPARGAGRRHR